MFMHGTAVDILYNISNVLSNISIHFKNGNHFV